MGRYFFSSLLTIIRSFIRCKEIFLTFAVFFLPGMIAGTRPEGKEFNDPAFLVRSLLFSLPQIGLLIYLLRNFGNRNLRDYCITPSSLRLLRRGFLAFLGILPILLGFLLLAHYLPQDIIASSLPNFRWRFTNYSLFPLVSIVCIVAAYREELYFRAYLITEFQKLGGSFLSSSTVAVLLFALGHLYQGMGGFIVALVLGVYLTIVFRLTRSVHTSALAHGLYNILVLLASGLLSP